MSQPSSTLLKQFGLRIRGLRIQKAWTQEDLGFHTNLHRTYIGSIERGERNVSLKNIEALAKAFDIEIKELFDFKDALDELD